MISSFMPTVRTTSRNWLTTDRYKMAGQWFGLPKLFPKSENLGYEIVKNDDTLIQFKNKQRWSFHLIPKQATINALVSLALDPATKDSDFPLILYHKVGCGLDLAHGRTKRTRRITPTKDSDSTSRKSKRIWCLL